MATKKVKVDKPKSESIEPEVKKTKATKAKKESTANRGMDLEKRIEQMCEYYSKNKIAQLFKLPTSWVVRRATNPVTKQSTIISAFPKSKSQCDYLGSYNGKALGIEAKRTNEVNRFPFANVKDHQWDFFKQWCNEGKALGYYIIWYKELNRAFLVDAIKFQEAKDTSDRKSVTLDWFVENSIELDEKMDFIKHIQ